MGDKRLKNREDTEDTVIVYLNSTIHRKGVSEEFDGLKLSDTM